MTSRQAWVFAGHGSQYPGMGRGQPFDAAEVQPVFAAAERLSGLPLRELSCHGDAPTLTRPMVLEPLLAAFALAAAARLQAQGHGPAAVAGYSAGLVPALVCAGVLDLDSALLLAARRGRVLEEAAQAQGGAMLAVFGLPVVRSLGALQTVAAAGRVDVAGWNSPTHLTLAGPADALQAAAAALEAAGAHTLPVPVAGAWHSRCCAGLAARCAGLAGRLHLRPPRVPVYSSVSARREDDPERLRQHLGQQIEAPVYWQATVASLCAGERLAQALELGCGRTLAGWQHGPAPGLRITPAARFSNPPLPLKKADYA